MVAALFAAGCASGGSSIKRASSGDEYMTLEDHLRRINGVTIMGSGKNAKVMLRGTRGISTISHDISSQNRPDRKTDLRLNDSDARQPLFVVDGQKIGRDYPDVRDMLAPGEIKSVKLLKASEATRYGSQSGHGVIEITTRSDSRTNKKS